MADDDDCIPGDCILVEAPRTISTDPIIVRGGAGGGGITVTGAFFNRNLPNPNSRLFDLDQCPSAPQTEEERKAAERGDRRAFWESRAARGDRVAQTALNIINNTGAGGTTANIVLNGEIAFRLALDLELPTPARINSINRQVGVALARAHSDALVGVSSGQLSSSAIARYHHNVFEEFGLAPAAFGGTILTGTEAEAEVYDVLWTSCGS